MKIVIPVALDLTKITATNVSTASPTAWSSGTNYVADDTVQHQGANDTFPEIYRALQASGPATSVQTPVGGSSDLYWTSEGHINAYKAFDNYIGDPVVNSGSITYTIDPDATFSAIGFFGNVAGSIRVQVFDGETEIYDVTKQVQSNTLVYDWITWMTQGEVFGLRNEIVFEDLPGSVTTYTLEVTIDNGSEDAEVGQIVLGLAYETGYTIEGSRVGIEDYSTIERNTFGQAVIVERDYANLVTLEVAVNTDEVARLRQILASLRVTPAIYYIDENTDQFGTTVYGFFKDFSIDLQAAGVSFCSIEIEGLT